MSPIAIIPVAGVGTRLRPHTHTQPKVLLHVAGKPILAHILDDLPALGIREVVLIVGYMGERIRDYVSAAIRKLEVARTSSSRSGSASGTRCRWREPHVGDRPAADHPRRHHLRGRSARACWRRGRAASG